MKKLILKSMNNTNDKKNEKKIKMCQNYEKNKQK